MEVWRSSSSSSSVQCATHRESYSPRIAPGGGGGEETRTLGRDHASALHNMGRPIPVILNRFFSLFFFWFFLLSYILPCFSVFRFPFLFWFKSMSFFFQTRDFFSNSRTFFKIHEIFENHKQTFKFMNFLKIMKYFSN